MAQAPLRSHFRLPGRPGGAAGPRYVRLYLLSLDPWEGPGAGLGPALLGWGNAGLFEEELGTCSTWLGVYCAMGAGWRWMERDGWTGT